MINLSQIKITEEIERQQHQIELILKNHIMKLSKLNAIKLFIDNKEAKLRNQEKEQNPQRNWQMKKRHQKAQKIILQKMKGIISLSSFLNYHFYLIHFCLIFSL